MLFGVDNTLLARALDGDVFEPYESPELADRRPRARARPEHRATPIDHGDVCINYDKEWFASRSIAPPRTLADLTLPRTRTSSSSRTRRRRHRASRSCSRRSREYGDRLAGLLGQAAGQRRAGRRRLGAGVRRRLLRRGGEQGHATRSSCRTRRARRRRCTSRSRSRARAPTGVVARRCFRQVEFVGRAEGRRAPEQAARELVDFMLSQRFQADMPLQMFVFPVRDGTPLPPVFTKFAGRARRPARRCRRARSAATATVDRRVDATRAAVSARAARVAHDRVSALVPLAFLGGVLRLPGRRRSSIRGLRAGRRARPRRRSRDVLDRPGSLREVVWFTVWQARAVDGAHARGRAARRVRPRPRTSSAASARAARSSSCRSCCRRSSWPLAFLGDPARRPRATVRRRSSSRTRSSTSPSSCASSAAFWAHLDPRIGEAAATLGASPAARVPRGHAAARSRPALAAAARSCSSSASRRSA